MFEQLSQTREEVVLKTYDVSIFGVVLRTDIVMVVHINSSLRIPCNQAWEINDNTSLIIPLYF